MKGKQWSCCFKLPSWLVPIAKWGAMHGVAHSTTTSSVRGSHGLQAHTSLVGHSSKGQPQHVCMHM